MKHLLKFENYKMNESSTSLKDRFIELVHDSETLGLDLKIDSRVELSEISDTLKKEFSDIYDLELDFTQYYGSDKFEVSMRVFNTKKDFDDNDASDYVVTKIDIPSNEDDW